MFIFQIDPGIKQDMDALKHNLEIGVDNMSQMLATLQDHKQAMEAVQDPNVPLVKAAIDAATLYLDARNRKVSQPEQDRLLESALRSIRSWSAYKNKAYPQGFIEIEIEKPKELTKEEKRNIKEFYLDMHAVFRNLFRNPADPYMLIDPIIKQRSIFDEEGNPRKIFGVIPISLDNKFSWWDFVPAVSSARGYTANYYKLMMGSKTDAGDWVVPSVSLVFDMLAVGTGGTFLKGTKITGTSLFTSDALSLSSFYKGVFKKTATEVVELGERQGLKLANFDVAIKVAGKIGTKEKTVKLANVIVKDMVEGKEQVMKLADVIVSAGGKEVKLSEVTGKTLQEIGEMVTKSGTPIKSLVTKDGEYLLEIIENAMLRTEKKNIISKTIEATQKGVETGVTSVKKAPNLWTKGEDALMNAGLTVFNYAKITGKPLKWWGFAPGSMHFIANSITSGVPFTLSLTMKTIGTTVKTVVKPTAFVLKETGLTYLKGNLPDITFGTIAKMHPEDWFEKKTSRIYLAPLSFSLSSDTKKEELRNMSDSSKTKKEDRPAPTASETANKIWDNLTIKPTDQSLVSRYNDNYEKLVMKDVKLGSIKYDAKNNRCTPQQMIEKLISGDNEKGAKIKIVKDDGVTPRPLQDIINDIRAYYGHSPISLYEPPKRRTLAA